MAWVLLFVKCRTMDINKEQNPNPKNNDDVEDFGDENPKHILLFINGGLKFLPLSFSECIDFLYLFRKTC